MSAIMFIYGAIGFLAVGGFAALVLRSKASYNNVAVVAVQTGESIDDVVLEFDRFRVIAEETDGSRNYAVVEFLKNRKREALAPSGKKWYSFTKAGSSVSDPVIARVDKKKLLRGCIFYIPLEGDVRVVQFSHVEDEHGQILPSLKIIDQDTIAWLSQRAKKRDKMMSDKTEKWAQVALWAIPIVIGAAVFIFALVWAGGLAETVIGEAGAEAARIISSGQVADPLPGG